MLNLTAGALIINYRLEVDQLTVVYDDLPAFSDEVDLTQLSKPAEFYEAFLRCYAPVIGRRLFAALDGKNLEFACTRRSYRLTDDENKPLDHLRCDFVFRARWTFFADSPQKLAFREGNFDLEDGRILLSISCDESIILLSKNEPDKALQERAAIDRQPGDDARLRNASAVFQLSGATAAPTAPLAPEATHTDAHNLLDLLLDPQRGFWILMIAAALFGAAHALTPGHGKTLVAAYLVGERGTATHAVILGMITTLTHTGAVLVLAAALLYFFPDAVPADVQSALGLIGGLLVAGMGFWLLLRRLSGGADHIHIGGGHHHHHRSESAPSAQGVRFWNLVVLGVSGGIVPCWDAIAMLGFAISAHRLWLALPLLLAFSAGLAGVLIAIGIGVVYVKGFSNSRWGQGRIVQALPLVSAVLVTILGLWLCYDSVHSTPAAATASERP